MPDDIAQEEDLPCDFAIRFAAARMSVFMPEQLMCAAVSVRSQCFPFSEIRVPHFPLLSKQRPRKSERERAAGSGSHVNSMSDHHVSRTARYDLCGCLHSYI